jgi:hypothetical protein
MLAHVVVDDVTVWPVPFNGDMVEAMFRDQALGDGCAGAVEL